MMARSAASSRACARRTSSASGAPASGTGCVAVRWMAVTGLSPISPGLWMQAREKGSRKLLIRLDRQARVPGPLAHRRIVQRELVVAERGEQEQVDRRRDTAAAIADHTPVARDPLRGELGLRIRERGQRLV